MKPKLYWAQAARRQPRSSSQTEKSQEYTIINFHMNTLTVLTILCEKNKLFMNKYKKSTAYAVLFLY